MEIHSPKYLREEIIGSFEINKETISSLMKAIEPIIPNSQLMIELAFRDGTKNTIDNLEEIEDLPVGKRRQIQNFSIEVQSKNNDRSSCKVDFSLRFPSLTLSTHSETNSLALFSAAEKATHHFRTWYSFLYPPHEFLYWQLLIWGWWGFIILNPFDVENNIFILVIFGLIYAFFLSLPLTRFALFDKIVLNFNAGKKREKYKDKTRKFLVGGTGLMTVLSMLLKPILNGS